MVDDLLLEKEGVRNEFFAGKAYELGKRWPEHGRGQAVYLYPL
jgi:hypothetical protein